ncbi:MAG: beta strand repeat-containing protein [Gaiellales bacterium]
MAVSHLGPRPRRAFSRALCIALLIAGGALLTSSAVASTATITAGGAAVRVATTVSGENATITFPGTAGQRVSLKLSSVTIAQSYVSITAPDGTTVAPRTLMGTTGLFVDTKTLPKTGTYAITVDPVNTYVGAATLQLYDVPPDASSTIVPGGAAVSVATSTPGQNARLSFSGSAGARVSLRMTGVTMTQAAVSIVKPDGTNLVAPLTVGSAGTFVDTKSLDQTGSYAIVVNPAAANVGSMTLQLYDVPPDETGSITAGGAAVALTIAAPGQNGRLTFAGTAGRKVSLKLSSVTITSSSVTVVNPDGTNLVAATSVGTAGTFIDTKTLAQTGTYTIQVNPASYYTGAMTVTLYDVPADASAAIAANGSPVTLNIAVPGQNGRLTFPGTAGQRVSLRFTGVTITQSTVQIKNPDGTNLGAAVTVGTAGAYVDTKVLGQAGTYVITINPAAANTGGITTTLYDVPSDPTPSLTAGGPAVGVTIATPGQNARPTFAGTLGQRVSLALSSSTLTQAYVSIVKPDGTNLVAPTLIGSGGGFIDTKTLPVTGTYTILIDPVANDTGSVTLTLYDVPADIGTPITPGGSAVSPTLGTPGQNASLPFSGTAGQQVSLAVTGNSISSVTVTIRKPDGTTLASVKPLGTTDAFIDAQTLPVTGGYTILVDPAAAATGTVTLRLYAVPADVTGSITPGGAAVTTTATTPGQSARISFAGTAGRRISLRLTNVTIGNAVYAGSQVSILKPDGTALVSPVGVTTGGNFIDVRALPVTGTYVILVDPTSSNTGSMTLTLYDVPADPTVAITPNGPSVTLTIGTPGQNGTATFSGTVGDTLTLSFVDGTSNGKVSILKPDGTVLASPTGLSPISSGIPVAGTYTILADPQAYVTGSMTLTLKTTNLPPPAPTLTIGENSPNSSVGPGPVFYYRPAGTGGTFTVFAAAAGGVALQKVRFPGLSGGVTPTALVDDTSSPYSQNYTWSTGAGYTGASNVVTAYDFAGRTASSSFGVTADPTAPVTTDNSAAIGTGWKNAAQTVVLTPTDPLSGVSTTYSTTDGTTPTTSSLTGTSIMLIADGTYTVKYFSVDKVGNTEAVKTSSAIRIDTVAPSSSTLDPLPATIRNGQVLSGSGADALSGVASISYYRCAGTTCTPNVLIGTGAGTGYAYTWTAQPADGTYRILARVADAAGNTLDSAVQTVTIDNTPPDTTITSRPPSASNQTTASFAFTATEAATFQCQLDNGAWTACSSPATYSGLATGAHTFAVRATDTVGTVDPTPATAAWTIDLTAPDTSITSTPANPTNQTTATFAFTATEAATFQCQLDGGLWTACSSPATYNSLSSAGHTFSVRATDAAGNTDATPAGYAWTIDAIPPDTTITAGASGTTSATQATFNFTASKTPATFQCRLDGGSWSACAGPISYSGLADGSHTFAVAATDAVGNTDPTPATRTWTVDTAAPDTAITGKPADPSNQATPSFSFSATEAGSFLCQVDGGSWTACTSPSVLSPLGEGAHTFAVQAVDAAGNADATPATFTWNVDLTAPGAVTIDAAPSGRTAQTSAAFSFSSTDPSVTGYRCQLDGAPATPAACNSPATYSGLPSAAHTFTVYAADAAGNLGSPASAGWIVDATGPAVTLTTPADGSATPNVTPTFSGTAGTATGDIGDITVKVYSGTGTGGAVSQTLLTTASAGSWSVAAGASLADGVYTVQAGQSDDLGNSAVSSPHTFTVDTAAPAQPAITQRPAATSASTSPSFGFSGEPGATYRCSLDGAAATVCASPRSYAGVSGGAHTFSVVAVDAAGNQSAAASAGWTIDATSPSLTGKPASTSASTAPTFSFGHPTYSVFSCKLDAAAFSSCTAPKPYTGLAPGSHTFTVRAFDSDGVATADATYTWTVQTAAPTISAKPAATSAATAPSFSFAASPYTGFACKLDGASFAACTSPATYSGLANGSHTFTVHAFDGDGVGTADATYTWTVNAAPPTLSLTTKATGGTTTATATFSHPAYTSFECQLDTGSWAACTSPKAFSVATGSGLHTANVRAIDAAGVRTAIASATFTA